MLIVTRHADVGQVLGNAVPWNDGIEFRRALKFGSILRSEVAVARQAARDLPRAVSPVVEIDADIAIANGAHRLAATIDDNKWNDELVGDAAVVRLLHALHRTGKASAFAVAEHHGIKSLLFAVPLLIAVHGVIAPAHTGDLPDVVFAHL